MISLTAYVLPSITDYNLASQIQPLERWLHLRDLELADPKPESQHPIHLLIVEFILIDICARIPLSGPDGRFECVWCASRYCMGKSSHRGKSCVARSRIDTQFYFRVPLLDFENVTTMPISKYVALEEIIPPMWVVLGLIPCNKSKPMFPLTAYVCKNLTSYTALAVRPPKWWPHLRGLPLVDPNPSKEPIHLLIGADLYGSLVLSDLRRDPFVMSTAQKTELSWIISGPVDIGSCTVFEAHVSHCISECNADSLLRKSWADEKISVEITKLTVHYVDCASDWRLPH